MTATPPPDAGPVRVVALYRFAAFADREAIRDRLAARCGAGGVKGTLLIAHEGINGTIAGTHDAIEAVLEAIRMLPGCVTLDLRESTAAAMPFHRMKVRVKEEIVSLGQPQVDPVGDVGTYVAPDAWNALIAQDDVVVIDTRNDYEVAVGSFAGAVDPGTRSFRDFPAWFRAHRDELLKGEHPRVAMFCTGGIRCEKATAFLKSEGVEEVYHLKGGILHYLDTVPAVDSRWQGECFVFDERVAVGHGLAAGTHDLCRGCRMPVSEADRASPLLVEGIACPRCHDDRSDTQRAGYAERHRQTQLAERRGETHVGAAPPDRTGVRRDRDV